MVAAEIDQAKKREEIRKLIGLCPLSLVGVGDLMSCQKEKCKWYDTEKEDCAAFLFMKAVYSPQAILFPFPGEDDFDADESDDEVPKGASFDDYLHSEDSIFEEGGYIR